MIEVKKVTASEVKKLILGTQLLSEMQNRTLDLHLASTGTIYAGYIRGAFVCAWGLMPPTLLSNTAYLWLYTTDALAGNEFLFVRHSQVQLNRLFEEYDVICGVVSESSPHSQRWLQWLGAHFAEPEEGVIPFEIYKEGRAWTQSRSV